MNNRYLFRGKCVKSGKWVFGGYHYHVARQTWPIGEDSLKEGAFEHLILKSGFADWNMVKPLEAFQVDGDTVGQCIGICDSCGRWIFEGDILKHYKGFKTLVVWSSGRFRGLGDTGFIEIIDTDVEAEIVGNRFDNAELIQDLSVTREGGVEGESG